MTEISFNASIIYVMTEQKDMVILPNLYIKTASYLQKNMLLHHSQTAGYAIKHNNSVCLLRIYRRMQNPLWKCSFLGTEVGILHDLPFSPYVCM